MAARNATKAAKAAEQKENAGRSQVPPPPGEQQEQASEGAKTAAQGQQSEAPPVGSTADYIEAVGFTLDENGNVGGNAGLALPPVIEGAAGAAMVLSALFDACLPPACTVTKFDVTVDASGATPGVAASEDAAQLMLIPAVADVLAERLRQVSEKGFAPAHDAQYQNGELAQAAACYALFASGRQSARSLFSWPFLTEAFRPHDKRRAMVKAAAMLLAAIEAEDATAEPAP